MRNRSLHKSDLYGQRTSQESVLTAAIFVYLSVLAAGDFHLIRGRIDEAE